MAFNIIKARECAKLWLGTPHHDRMAKVGAGIDCIHFVREILIAGGMTDPFKCPYYLPRWGIGRGNNVLERLLLKCYDAAVVPFGKPLKNGDIFIFAVGKQSNHCGIVLDGECWHSQARHVVHPMKITPDILERLQSVVRIKKPGLRFRPELLTSEDFKQ